MFQHAQENKNCGLEAVLCQTVEEGEYIVIACASRQLLKHKRITERIEMQTMVWATESFDTFLRGIQFTVFTDHKPLETQNKHQNKTMTRLTTAFLNTIFVIEKTRK
jgi:hypothetical protein